MIRRRFAIGFLLMGVMACQPSVVHINATYGRLAGMVSGDHVLFQGNVAGSVTDVQYTSEGSYTLKLKIAKGFASAATEYSQFHIVDDPNREGRKAVEIRLTQQGGKMLANGTTVQGVTPPELLADRLQRDLEAGFNFILSQIEKFSRDVHKVPDSEVYKKLKQSMEALAAEIQRAEKEARDRVKDEWLPKIERQLDALREQLQKLGREKELQPLEERVNRIRRI